MARKNSVNISLIVVIRVIVFLFIGFVLFTTYVNMTDFLTSSPVFEIKDVMIDRSIQFIDQRALKDLKGMNIFKVDINKIDRQIARHYPYIAQLKVVRQLPNRILVLAKKREPLLQIYYKDKYLLVDKEGVALYYILKPNSLPEVFGVDIATGWTNIGASIQGLPMAKALEVLNSFRNSRYLTRLRIKSVQVGNLSKIDILTVENMHVILDQENTEDKIGVLQMLVASNKIDLNKVKYIDLRFKEPVIANKSDLN